MSGIQYSGGSITPTGAFRLEDFVFINNPIGPTSVSGYYSTIDVPANGWVIYQNKTGGPSIYVAQNDSECIEFTQHISNQNITTIQQCISYFQNTSEKLLVGRDVPNIVTRGLIMYVDAGLVQSYPRTGTTWTDLSTAGRNATLVGGAGFTTDGGGAIEWSGDNTEYGTFTSATIPRNGGSFSIWFTAGTDFTSNYANRGSLLSNGNVYQSLIGVWQQYGLEGETNNNGNVFCALRNNTTLNNGWNNLQTVFSANTAYNYVNGTLVETVSGLTNDLIVSQINNSSNLSGNYEDYQGNMGTVQLYNVALTPEEVEQNWEAIRGRHGL
jgi:hypothetical protein